MTETIRAFIAIELSNSVKSALGEAIRQIDAAGIRGVRTVRPDGIHLTLKFLGEINRDRTDAISEAIRRASLVVSSFGLTFGEVGVFPSWKAPRVLWVGLDGDLKQLNRLHDAIEKEMNLLGFETDNRPYNPHLTLARVRDVTPPDDRLQAARVLTELKLPSDALIEGNATSLMSTIFTPDGAKHTAVAMISLKN